MALYNKVIKAFNRTGACGIHVNYVCKHWGDNYSISKQPSGADGEKEYRLLITRKNNPNRRVLKVTISFEQAMEVIDKLSLIELPSVIFRRCSGFHTESAIRAELANIAYERKEKFTELENLAELYQCYDKALKAHDLKKESQ